jgi:hypothetical protein
MRDQRYTRAPDVVGITGLAFRRAEDGPSNSPGHPALFSLSAPAWQRTSSFTSVKEMTMTIEQHIEELRAELRTCISRKERRQIERELQPARDELARRLASRCCALSPTPPPVLEKELGPARHLS